MRYEVTERLKKLYCEEVEASCQDSLTGLFNRGFFHCTLEQEIKRFKRYGTTFALVFLDIDSFSALNRRLGYLHGDRLIKDIGTYILDNLRDVDVAARYNEDRFAMLLPETDSRSSEHPVQRILRDVEEKSGREVTVSAGIAACPEDGTRAPALLTKAFNALEKAKLQGKNRLVYASQETEDPPLRSPTILVVDDDKRNAKLFAAMLASENYTVATAYSGEEALSLVEKSRVDLILLDIMMPGMNGYEVCRLLKEEERTRLIPVVMVTALDDRDSKIKSIECGADEFLTKPPETVELLTRVRSLIRVKSLNDNLTSVENVLFSFANAVESKDGYTQSHVNRVSSLAEKLGRRLNLPSNDIKSLRIGGALHDLGKLAISDELLNKPGALSDEEWEEMRQHPIIGEKIAMPLKDILGLSLDIIRHHHEKLDGSGYPDGLKGDAISIPARIMAVVDIYDALVTDRSYRKGFPEEKAFAILHQEADEGKLDPGIVDALEEMIKEKNSP